MQTQIFCFKNFTFVKKNKVKYTDTHKQSNETKRNKMGDVTWRNESERDGMSTHTIVRTLCRKEKNKTNKASWRKWKRIVSLVLTPSPLCVSKYCSHSKTNLLKKKQEWRRSNTPRHKQYNTHTFTSTRRLIQFTLK